VEFGAHLPLIVGRDSIPDARELAEYAALAEELGFFAVAANDHIVFRTGWLDGPACLSAVAGATGRVRLVTTVLVPALRHPLVAAKTLSTLDRLSGGRVIAGLGPGSFAADNDALGLPFDERWQRFDECVRVMRHAWGDLDDAGALSHYDAVRAGLDPGPLQRPLPVWIASWGSQAGLRRAVRLGDGWLASAYNTTPAKFAEDRSRVQHLAADAGKPHFTNGVATMMTYITEDHGEAERVARDVLSPALGRAPEELLDRLLLGSADHCAERLRAYRDAGAQRVFIWPAADPRRQLEVFAERVVALVG
jgi:alkanesulfonate monooxygenase SsuD/methylene tetrahydromethanopterin reductase-like flavin-dependent oxidoreductase (luciferase family)